MGPDHARRSMPPTPSVLPEPAGVPPWRGFFADGQGAHTLDLTIEAERNAFEAACRRWVGADEACDVRRVTALRTDTSGRRNERALRLPSGAIFEDKVTRWLVIAPGHSPLGALEPAYPADHPRHEAAALDEARSAALIVLVQGVMAMERGKTSGTLHDVWLDPWDRRWIAHYQTGSFAFCGGRGPRRSRAVTRVSSG